MSPDLFCFSTDDLPPADRLAYWRDFVCGTYTNYASNPIDPANLLVTFDVAAGEGVTLARGRANGIANYRDRQCLRDGEDSVQLFLMGTGTAQFDHRDARVEARRGEAVLTLANDLATTTWSRADAFAVRIERNELRGHDVDRIAGQLQTGNNPVLRLLQSYARTAWRAAARGEGFPAIAQRHIAELVGALCTPDATVRGPDAKPALRAARVAAMREVIARHSANPCLTMREVAAAVGLSERAGHLAFEAARLTFTEELQAIRLERACERLARGGERVLDVAYAVGFSDASHFHRLFKRRFGCTPGELRYDS